MLGLQPIGRGQRLFQAAGDLVEPLARHRCRHHQRHVRIRQRHLALAQLPHGGDGGGGGLGPVVGRGTQAQGAGRHPLHAGIAGRLHDPVAARIVAGRAGVEAAAVIIHHEPQREGRDHRTRRGDLQVQRDLRRCGPAQRLFQPALILAVGGQRRHLHLSRRDRDLGLRGHLGGLQPEAQRLGPAVGDGVVRGLQQVGHLLARRAQSAQDRVAVGGGRNQPDQRQALFALQQLDLEIGGRHRLDRGDGHLVQDARGVDGGAGLGHRTEPLDLGRGGAGQADAQPVGRHLRPVMARGLQGLRHIARGAILDEGRCGLGPHPGQSARAGQHDDGGQGCRKAAASGHRKNLVLLQACNV